MLFVTGSSGAISDGKWRLRTSAPSAVAGWFSRERLARADAAAILIDRGHLADQGNSEAQIKLGLMYRISISALLQEYHLRRWHTHRHQCSLGI